MTLILAGVEIPTAQAADVPAANAERRRKRPFDDRRGVRVRWLAAAAVYNACWGCGAVILAGSLGWKVVGMMVAVYAPAYWWAARLPERHAHLVAIGLLGKSLGLVGFVGGWAFGLVPASFGLVVLVNDAIWWPALARFVSSAARAAGGWRAFASGAGG